MSTESSGSYPHQTRKIFQRHCSAIELICKMCTLVTHGQYRKIIRRPERERAICSYVHMEAKSMKSPSLYTHGAFTGQQVKGLHFSFFFVNSRVSGGLLSEAAYDHYKRTKKTEQTQNDGREGQIKEEKFEERERGRHNATALMQ